MRQAVSHSLAHFAEGAIAAMRFGMEPAERVREIMDLKDWTQAELAAELGVTQPTVNRWLSGSDPRGAVRDRLIELHERVTGRKAGKIRRVPVVGYVAAGSQAFYADAQGPFDMVDAPEDATKDTVAVEVRGESLGALFDQWLVFYDEIRSPVTPDLIGRLCVVGLLDDRILVKQIKRSKTAGLFHLLSNTEPPILDVEVVWAARVRHMSPR